MTLSSASLPANEGEMSTTQQKEADLYVAPDGDDANPGSFELPFATLHKARDTVRDVREAKEGPVVVLVRGGTYYLENPLVLAPEDSGTEDQPITYAAYPDETPIISGGRRLDVEWRTFRDGIMLCEIPEVKAGKLDFAQVFVNGKRQIRARYPNCDPENPLVQGKGYINAAGPLSDDLEHKKVSSEDALTFPTQGPKGFSFDPATFTKKSWAKPEEAVIQIFSKLYWGSLRWQIESIDWDRHVIWFGKGGFQLSTQKRMGGEACGIRSNSRFYIENVFEELDAPGEWYLDKESGILYYMPEDGLDLSAAIIEVPILKQVIAFRGSQDTPVRHVTMSGFHIRDTTCTYFELYEIPSRGNWTLHRAGAVFLEGTEHCAVVSCFFDAVGGNGVFLSNYNRRNRVTGCKFTEAGESAVCLVGSRHLTLGSHTAFPADNLVSNNLIHDCGAFGKEIAGVFCSNTMRATISHNEIYNMPRSGICINDGFGGGHIIEYNDVYNTVRETSDHGGINSWGREWFWCATHSHDADSVSPHRAGDVLMNTPETSVIRYNYVHRVDEFVGSDYRQGIVLDDGSSNYHVHHNVCVEMAIGLREGAFRTVENNIILDPVVPVGFHVGYDENHDVFRRNIIVTADDVYILSWPPPTEPWLEIDYNLFSNPSKRWMHLPTVTVGPREGEPIKHTLSEWCEMGYDTHSVCGDPRFIAAESGDFRLRPESPAMNLGFQSFDVRSAGLLPDFPERWREEQPNQVRQT